MRWLVAFFSVALVALQGQLWLGSASVPELIRLREAVAEQKAENERAAARNEALAAEVANLREGTRAIEERARYELGMIQDDEVFYQVVEE